MRFLRSVTALITAVLLAACGTSVPAPSRDPAGDTAFVAALTALCSKTPSLVAIDPTASIAAISNAADADDATVTNFVYGMPFPGARYRHNRIQRKGGLSALTPTISSGSPLVVRITATASMLIDARKWYVNIARLAKVDETKPRTAATRTDETNAIIKMSNTAQRRETQARSDLSRLGMTTCFS